MTSRQSQRSSDVGFHASRQGTQAGIRVHRIHTGHCGGLDFVTAVQNVNWLLLAEEVISCSGVHVGKSSREIICESSIPARLWTVERATP